MVLVKRNKKIKQIIQINQIVQIKILADNIIVMMYMIEIKTFAILYINLYALILTQNKCNVWKNLVPLHCQTDVKPVIKHTFFMLLRENVIQMYHHKMQMKRKQMIRNNIIVQMKIEIKTFALIYINLYVPIMTLIKYSV